MQRHPQGYCALRVTAHLYVFCIGFKRIPFGGKTPQLRQVWLHELSQKSADNNIAVQRHAYVVDSDRKVLQNILPQALVLGLMLLQPFEKFFQSNSQIVAYACSRAICFKAAGFAAFARQTVWLNAHVAKLAASAVDAFIRRAF